MPIVYACLLPDGAVALTTGGAIASVADEVATYEPDLALIVRSGGGSRIEIDNDALAEQVSGVTVSTNAGSVPPPNVLALGELATATITTSRLALREHFELGRALGRALVDDERRIAIVGIGTLSHALDQLARGYDPAGRLFDEQYRRAIEGWSVKWLVNLDAGFRSSAREDATTQTAVLMGLLAESRVQPRLVSYEVTSGVGHLVAAIDVLGPRRTKAGVSSVAEEE